MKDMTVYDSYANHWNWLKSEGVWVHYGWSGGFLKISSAFRDNPDALPAGFSYFKPQSFVIQPQIVINRFMAMLPFDVPSMTNRHGHGNIRSESIFLCHETGHYLSWKQGKQPSRIMAKALELSMIGKLDTLPHVEGMAIFDEEKRAWDLGRSYIHNDLIDDYHKMSIYALNIYQKDLRL